MTITDEMVERAARAVHDAEITWKAANGGDDASTVDCPDEIKARAALTAALGDSVAVPREATVEMIQACLEEGLRTMARHQVKDIQPTSDSGVVLDHVRCSWRAMVAAAPAASQQDSTP